jgi:hypothetical protein
MYYFRREEKWEKELIREIAKEFNVDVRVARTCVWFPMLYLKRRIQDKDNNTPVRIRHLGVWDLKNTVKDRLNVTKD